MNNKYTWVIFNLVSAVLCIIMLELQDTSNIAPPLSIVIIGLYIACGYWIYRSIIYWRKCIQADDKAFDCIVSQMNNSDEKKEGKDV